MERPADVPVLDEISREECLSLLSSHHVGRIAVAAPGAPPLVVPVNSVVDGEMVVFRSRVGSKLRSLRGTPVSFQLDEIDPVHREGWSVLVRGWAYETTRHHVPHLDIDTWVPGTTDHWVRIVADSISGRRIRSNEPSVDLGGYL